MNNELVNASRIGFESTYKHIIDDLNGEFLNAASRGSFSYYYKFSNDSTNRDFLYSLRRYLQVIGYQVQPDADFETKQVKGLVIGW